MHLVISTANLPVYRKIGTNPCCLGGSQIMCTDYSLLLCVGTLPEIHVLLSDFTLKADNSQASLPAEVWLSHEVCLTFSAAF